MADSVGQHSIGGWWDEEVLLEHYRYAPGPAAELPKHVHEEYQLGFSVDFPGEYGYRGALHAVPVGSLTVIPAGEPHSARDPMDRAETATFRMMYAGLGTFEEVVRELAGPRKRAPGPPAFQEPVFRDEELARSFVRLHEASEAGAPRLEQETRVLAVLSGFVQRHATTSNHQTSYGREHLAVRRAREYLEDNSGSNVSLGELSSVVNLSPFHLSRVFAETVGMPPHAYLVAVRVYRAKDLLLRGWPVARAAREAGFSDQSHFSNHFKRFIGVSPGSYVKNSRVNSKILQ